VALVLLDPGLDGTAGLPDVDLSALAGHAVYNRSLEFQVVLYGPEGSWRSSWVGPQTRCYAWTVAC
jgi:hypothetical protein